MAGFDRNLELVEEHLDQCETIKASVFGVYECKIMGADTIRNGIFVATENRIVFFAKKLMGYDLEVFPFENITSIEQSKGIMGHKITFFASGNKSTIKWINEGNVDQFYNYVNSMIGKHKNREQIVHSVAVDDIPTQIKKLSDLKDAGILTEEQFEKKKIELLSRM